jgi:hypothetical protein
LYAFTLGIFPELKGVFYVKVPSSPYKRGREGTCKRIQTFWNLCNLQRESQSICALTLCLTMLRTLSCVRGIIRIFRVTPNSHLSTVPSIGSISTSRGNELNRSEIKVYIKMGFLLSTDYFERVECYYLLNKNSKASTRYLLSSNFRLTTFVMILTWLYTSIYSHSTVRRCIQPTNNPYAWSHR